MNKQQIILEHRQALDAMEVATSEYNTCRRKGQCGDGTKCLTCPANNQRLQAETILKEKSDALNTINNQIIERNDALVFQKLSRRQETRLKKEMKDVEKKQTYNREDLTPERYQNHKKVDKFTDDKIREMYGDYPKSSFEKWKRDNGLVNGYKKDVAQVGEKADASLQRKYDKLKLENDSLKLCYEEAVDKCRSLEVELASEQELSATKTNLIKSLELDIKNLEQEQQAQKSMSASSATSTECGSCVELAEYKQIADRAVLELKNYQQEVAATIQHRDDQDEEVADAINKQMKRFCQYETMLLERILQLKREK